MTPKQRKSLESETRLSEREIKAFVSNAQLALTEHIPDDFIPALYSYKEDLVTLLSNTRLPNDVMAALLVSAAYDFLSGRADGRDTD